MYNFSVTTQDYNQLLEKIPNTQRIELQKKMLTKKFKEIKLLRGYLKGEEHHNFMSWISPLF